MILSLTLTGHSGDSPIPNEDGPGHHYDYKTLYDFKLDTSEPTGLLASIDTFINEWVTAQLFECYNIIEHERQKAYYRYELLKGVDRAMNDMGWTTLFKDRVVTADAFTYDLRLAQDPADVGF